ncbi:uncharacterized protein LOC133178648 [Saccostrea echinata]|uniref:uncharacterized protein LOC133178648 n=1 Tax=Saccostrea echinata TaxID=191078 RepID=UPI002A816433|nr:uncharacterized protein LOC133178648 [Saccostrea echinata]
MQQLQMYFFLCIVFVSLKIVLCSIKNCIGHAQNGKCKECLPGYIGQHCSHNCRYPSYGKGCQHVCKCDPSVCHVVSGCSQSKECQPGYFGVNCLHECRYPNYGVNCQLFCLCDEQLCDRKTGCAHISTIYKNTTRETTTVARHMTTEKHTSFQSTISQLNIGTQRITTIKYSTNNSLEERFTKVTLFKNISVSKSYNSSSESTESSGIFNNVRFRSNISDQLLINNPLYLILAIGFTVSFMVAAIYAINKCRKRRGVIVNDFVKDQNVPVYYEPIQALVHDKNLLRLPVPESNTMSYDEHQQSEANPYETIENDEEDSTIPQLDRYPPQNHQPSTLLMPKCEQPSRVIDENTDSDGYQCPCPPEKGREGHDFNNEYLIVV